VLGAHQQQSPLAARPETGCPLRPVRIAAKANGDSWDRQRSNRF
jgi:hypothetical protein